MGKFSAVKNIEVNGVCIHYAEEGEGNSAVLAAAMDKRIEFLNQILKRS